MSDKVSGKVFEKASERPSGNSSEEDREKSSTKGDKFIESNAGDGTTVFDHYLKGTKLLICFLSCFFSLFLIGLDQTIVFTIMETIADKFDGHSKIAWISSSYMLPMAVLASTWGQISITYGRKTSIIVAIIIFEIGSLICGLAQSIEMLIVGRVIAGIGGGGIQTLTFIIATEIVPINKRSVIFACLGMAFSVSSVLGPLLGGVFTEKVSWRWAFYINLPIGTVVIFALFFTLNPPKTKGNWREKLRNFDYVGTILLCLSLVLILLGMSLGCYELEWKSGGTISIFVIGGLSFVAFCVWNFKYSKIPVIPWFIIRVPQVDFAIISLLTCFYSFMGTNIYLTTYFQVLQGTDALHTGFHLLPMIIAAVISSVSSGLLIKKTRYIKPFGVIGGLIGSVGIGCLSLLKYDSTGSAKIGLLILPGIANGLILQAGIMAAQLCAPKKEGSTIIVTALFNFARSLGGSLGGILSQLVFNSSLTSKLNSLDSSWFELIDRDAVLDNPSLVRSLTVVKMKDELSNCIMGSIRNVFYVSTAFACVTFILTCLYTNKRVPKAHQVAKRADIPFEEKN